MAAKKKTPKTPKKKGTQQRVQEIADELAQAAGRLRDALDEARPVTAAELDAVRKDLAGLATRVGALEAASKRASAAKATPARRPAARKPAAGTATSRVPAARAAAKRAPKRATPS